MEKQKAQLELVKLDLADVMDKMNTYAIKSLKGISVKKLQGLEPIDLVMDIITKTCDGTRNWLDSNIEDMIDFLFDCLKSDLSNLKRKVNRHIELDKKHLTSDVTYANSPMSYEKSKDTDYLPHSYDNEDDKRKYYTDDMS